MTLLLFHPMRRPEYNQLSLFNTSDIWIVSVACRHLSRQLSIDDDSSCRQWVKSGGMGMNSCSFLRHRRINHQESVIIQEWESLASFQIRSDLFMTLDGEITFPVFTFDRMLFTLLREGRSRSCVSSFTLLSVVFDIWDVWLEDGRYSTNSFDRWWSLVSWSFQRQLSWTFVQCE